MTDYFKLAQAICARLPDDQLDPGIYVSPPAAGIPPSHRAMLVSVSRLLQEISDRFQVQEDRGDMTIEAEVLWSRCAALHHRIGEALIQPNQDAERREAFKADWRKYCEGWADLAREGGRK